MDRTPSFEEVAEGTELPELRKEPTSRQLVRYAGASGDFNEIHYDKDVALGQGLPGVVVQGALKSAFLAQVVTDWMGEGGRLRRLSVQYRGMDLAGEELSCRGRVARKDAKGGECLVECTLWIENRRGERTTHGRATVALPSRERGPPAPPYAE